MSRARDVVEVVAKALAGRPEAVEVTEFARAALERQLDPEMLERQAVLLGKQARRELTTKEREELETIGRLAKTLQDERAEAWEVLNKASQ